jgi:hypothetical protein
MSSLRRSRAASITCVALRDGETLPATRTARRQDLAAAGRLHPRTEAVHASPTAGLRLIGALHDRVPFFALKERSRRGV